MKEIPLTQGQVTTVDDADYEWLNQHKWHAHWNKSNRSFYATRGSRIKTIKQYMIYMTREILGLKRGDTRQGDHINHDTLDNSRENLRIVTSQQNHFNRKKAKGYSWDKRAKKYQARIILNNKRVYLGLFNTTAEAHAAYLMAKEKYHKVG